MNVNEEREEKMSAWNLTIGTQRQEWEAAVGVCWGRPGLAHEGSGAKGRPGPSPAEASRDAGQRNVVLLYVPRLGDKPKGTCVSS